MQRHAPDRGLSRRNLLGWSAAATVAGAAGLFAAWTTHNEKAPQRRVLFEDVFARQSLGQKHWNPYICDSNSRGWPWLMQPSVAVPSSAISRNGYKAEYDLPSAIRVDDGLTLRVHRGTKAAGYSWTGSVICSRPTSNNFGSGTVHTPGFTFADARVEVRAKMPDMRGGQWPAIWFLPAWNGQGAEIDLFEGGFLARTIKPNHVMAVDLQSAGNQQHFLDCHTDLSAGYHTYAMEYRQGSSIKIFFDGSNVLTYTHNVPVGPYFIILANGIASARAAGFHTQVNDSTPTVNLMRVSSVRVVAL